MEPNTPTPEVVSPNEVTLSDGRKAVVLKGKGKHAQSAMEQSEGNSKLYLSSLMALLITIEGKGVVPEDLAELDMKDYNTLLAKFTDINF